MKRSKLRFNKISKTLFAITILGGFSSVASSCSSSKLETIKLNYVIDGDTFKDLNNQSYRIHGIDAPEIHVKNSAGVDTTGWQHYYAIESKNFMQQLLKNLSCEVDLITTDIYQRKVVRAYYDESDLGYEMVLHGLAIVAFISINPGNRYFTSDNNYYKKLVDAQFEAQKLKQGLWVTHNADSIKEIYPN